MVGQFATPATPATHFFTVDVEEYFQVSAFDRVVSRDDWSGLPRRLDHCLPPLIERMQEFGARGTFFALGWVAEHSPHIVRRIVDAGHEVASHGYWHRRVMTMTAEQFRKDLRDSKRRLEDVAGQPVVGFRAPSFSIIPGCEWAFDVLVEEGFRYDSSIFPIRRAGYGYPGAPRTPYIIRRGGGALAEFPLATTSVFGFRVPAAGGGYLRQFPFGVIRSAFARASAAGTPATFYIHPWELDPDQPRLSVPWLTRVRHYRGLAYTLERITRLLREFRFTSMASGVEHVMSTPRAAAGFNA